MSKRILSLLLATLMIVGCFMTTSCSKKPEPEKSRVTHVYKSTDVELPNNFNTSELHLTDEGLLIRCQEVLSENPYEVREVMLSLDMESGEYTIEAIPEMEENVSVSNILPLADDDFLYVTLKEDEAENLRQYRLEQYANGALTMICEDIEPLFDIKTENAVIANNDFYVQNLQVDGDGNIYIATDSLIGVFDGTMRKLFEIELTGWLDDMGTTSEGKVYVRFYDRVKDTQVFKYIDAAERNFGEDVTAPTSKKYRDAHFYLGVGYDMYINDGAAVYGYNEGSEPVELLNWLNSDIISGGIRDLVILDENTFVANYYEENEDLAIRELYILKRLPDEEVPERYVIDLAVRDIASGFSAQVVKFNRSSDTYRVRFIDYSQYNTDEDPLLAETTLYQDIASGNAPDVIAFQNFNTLDGLIEDDAFLDLYTFMEKDASFDPTTLFQCVLEPFEHQGTLPFLVTEFMLSTLVGKSENLPGEHWTADEFLDWAEQLSEKQFVFEITGSFLMFNTLFCRSSDQFIDMEKGTVDFDNDTFRRMLEYCKDTTKLNYQKTLSGDALADYEADRGKVYRENTILLNEIYLSDLASILNTMFTFGFEEVTFIGYPSNESGTVVYPSQRFAITKDSLVAEGAWEFLKSILENANTSMQGSYFISSSREKFRRTSMENLKMHYFFHYDGGSSGSPNDDFLNRYEDSMGVYRDPSEADIVLLEKIIDGATTIPSYVGTVTEMMMEDLTMYFAGDKTLDETIAIMENRVGLYISERN